MCDSVCSLYGLRAAFSTISGPSGNENGYNSGFALTDSGIQLYGSDTPADTNFISIAIARDGAMRTFICA